jgi:hypothetical protein
MPDPARPCRILPAARRAAPAALLAALAVAGALHAPPAAAGVRFDFEPQAFAPLDHYVKDHAILRAGDRYHLIYTTGTDSLGRWMQPGNEVHFGHATSPDLRHWTIEPPLLAGERAPWEARNRWAPDLIALPGGGYRLYYTGVNARIAQAVGIAESPSLDPGAVAFTPLAANPVYRPDTSWAQWDEKSWSNGRDPCVIEHAGVVWLCVTATHKDGRGALALARSTDGGRTFADQGPLLLGEKGEAIESPELVCIAERWFLLTSSDRRGGTWVLEAPSITGPWDYAKRVRWLESIAPEVWSDGRDWWISTHQSYQLVHDPRHRDRRHYLIGFDRLTIGPAGLAIAPADGLGADWPLVEGDAFTAQPTLGDNAAARGEPAVGVVGRGYLASGERFTWPPERPGESRGYAATGRLRSRPFILQGATMSLLVGGSAGIESTYVALRRVADGEILYRETGRGATRMDERVWAIAELRGVEVEIEIVDLDPHGRINVDEIVEHEAAASAAAVVLVAGAPNPFRDAIALSVTTPGAPPGAGPEEFTIAIHDVAGRRVRTLAVPAGAAGGGARKVVWDGRNDAGQPVASGVYFARLAASGRESVVRLVRTP